MLWGIILLFMGIVIDGHAQEYRSTDTEITTHQEADHPSPDSQEHDQGHQGGLPQLDSQYFPTQLFWLVVCFIVLYLLLSRGALPRIVNVIERRKNRIISDLDRAEELKVQAEKIETEIKTILNDARTKAQKSIDQVMAEIATQRDKRLFEHKQTITQRLEQSTEQIQEAKHAALKELDIMASTLTVTIIDRLTDKPCDHAEAKAAVLAIRAQSTETESTATPTIEKVVSKIDTSQPLITQSYRKSCNRVSAKLRDMGVEHTFSVVKAEDYNIVHRTKTIRRITLNDVVYLITEDNFMTELRTIMEAAGMIEDNSLGPSAVS